MSMHAALPTTPDPSHDRLRTELLGVGEPERWRTGAAEPAPSAAPAAPRSVVPTALELLESSPSLRRLSDSYHRSYRHMLARNRRQRLGLAVLVASVGVAAVLLTQSHAVTVAVAADLVLAVGVTSALGVGMLAGLWLRDDRRLRRLQGDRLLRALQFNCTLPEDRLQAFRQHADPTAAFFDCYDLWREQHPERGAGLSAVMRTLRGQDGGAG
jgi:hypothetical protein